MPNPRRYNRELVAGSVSLTRRPAINHNHVPLIMSDPRHTTTAQESARPAGHRAALARVFGLVSAVLLSAHATAAPGAHADLGKENAAPEVRSVADWVARSGDNGNGPFLIVDKRHAHVFVFDAGAHLTAHA